MIPLTELDTKILVATAIGKRKADLLRRAYADAWDFEQMRFLMTLPARERLRLAAYGMDVEVMQ
jgi:hypothetical protein